MRSILTIWLALAPALAWGQAPPSFTFTPTPSSGTVIGQANIGGDPASEEDWIAGFDASGQCVGASPIILDGGMAYIQLTLYGDDGTTPDIDEGMNEGESFTLRLYDASEDTVLIWWGEDFGDILIAGWTNTNGAPIPSLSDPTDIYDFLIAGCSDPAANNYVPGAQFLPAVMSFDVTVENWYNMDNLPSTSATWTISIDPTKLQLVEPEIDYSFGYPYVTNYDEYPSYAYYDCYNQYFYNYDYEDSLSTCTSQYWASDSAGTWTLQFSTGETLTGNYAGGFLLIDGGYEIDTTDYGYDDCYAKKFDLYDSFAIVNQPQMWSTHEVILEKYSYWAVSNWNAGHANGISASDNVLNFANSFSYFNSGYAPYLNDSLWLQVSNLLDLSDPVGCEYDDLYGCTDVEACNYDPEATLDNGNCEYITCAGCTDWNACNYCYNATFDDGSCDYEICAGCWDQYACNALDFKDYYFYNYIDDGSCEYETCAGCTDPSACNFDSEATIEDGSCAVLDSCGVCDGPGAIYTCGCSDISEGDCNCNGNVLDACGICGGTGTDIDADGICDDIDYCTDVESVNFSDEGNIGCLYFGCTDPSADNYNADPGVVGCEPGGSQCCIWFGCTDGTFGDGTPPACNYDPVATDDDGSCEYTSCAGCTDAGACNYDPEALLDDGNCFYGCLGCTNPCSGNYNPDATVDDGSCQPVLGCTDSEACNFDACADLNHGCTYADACGICGGPGAIYDCGCSDIPEGDCDCAGNVLDECGVCGGEGIPAGDCDCNGNQIDECGVCGGDGIPDSDCDCDGNVLDACGVCGGSGVDVDQDGLCDDLDGCKDLTADNYDAQLYPPGSGECQYTGCTDPNADNFDAQANVDAGCLYTGCTDPEADNYDPQANVAGECIFGGCTDPNSCNYDPDATEDDGNCLYLDVMGICGGGCTANCDGDEYCDDVDPCVGALDECGLCNGPGAVFECGCVQRPVGDCDCDGNQLDALGVCGGTCATDVDADGVCDVDEIPGCTNPFSCNFDANTTEDDGSCLTADILGACGGSCTSDADGDGVCDDVDACVGDLDACGVCNGPGEIYDCGCTGIPAGDCDCNGNQLDALGVCGGSCPADTDGDGVCDDAEVDGCTNPFACNYSAAATDDDGSCLTEDAIGACGGNCTSDADGDGVCDHVDACVGALDACGVCNGPGEIYDCGCTGIPAGDCDCDGNQLDALGVCGGSCPDDTDGDGVCDDAEVDGCTNPFACNYSAAATDDDGSCLTEDAIGACGGNCTADADGDGVCDDLDDCVGTLDACGVCNGPGEIYECGCTGIPAGDCDCNGNQLDALGVCGGSCPADTDGDGVCDNAEVFGCPDPSACNFNPMATEDNGACFYDDAIGVCGGVCQGDQDNDGICDSEDTCFGALDVCGICNGPGAVYSCGCQEIAPGACDCDGNTPDAIGVCDGDCDSDENLNGICDDVEQSLCGAGTIWNPLLGLCIGIGGDCPTDLDGNGSTGAADLLIFLTEFSTPCAE
jgi:hypothetical protein